MRQARDDGVEAVEYFKEAAAYQAVRRFFLLPHHAFNRVSQ